MKHFYLLFIALLLLAGCVQTPPAPPPSISISELQEQHRYLSALKSLNVTSRNDSDYVERRDALLAAARNYQSLLIHDLNELIQQQEFTKAEQSLTTAQSELPISQELEQFSEQLYAARDRYRQRYIDEITQLRSATLLKEQPLYLALQKAAGDPVLQQLVERQRADTEYFIVQLNQIGSRALAQNEFTKAAVYLGIVNQLSPSPAVAQQIKRADQALATNKQKQQTARSSEREQRYRETYSAFLQNLEQQDYASARWQLEQAKLLNLHSEEIASAQNQLDTAIHIFVKQQSDAGNRLYSDGHLEEALQHWREAAALTATPELTERIEKAQRFIDRLEELRVRAN